MNPTHFQGTLLKLLWSCLSWDRSVFLYCVWTYSFNFLNVLSTFLNRTTYDCCLNINKLDAHPFHLSCDICLRKFPLVARVPLIAAWRHGVIFSVLSSCHFRKGWKILPSKIGKDFLDALGYFPSSSCLCFALPCNSNASPGMWHTWQVGHMLAVVVNHRGCQCGVSLCGQQQWSKLVFNRSEAGCES